MKRKKTDDGREGNKIGTRNLSTGRWPTADALFGILYLSWLVELEEIGRLC